MSNHCNLRADLREFPLPLFGCRLVCDHKKSVNECHAHHLRKLCIDLAKTEKGVLRREQVHFAAVDNQSFDDDNDDTERLEDCEILNQSTTSDRITKLDETLIGRNIPDQVKWPDAWRELVDTVRQLPTKAFWEVFSGSARATN